MLHRSAQVRAAVWAIDRDQPVTYVRPLSELAAESVAFRAAFVELVRHPFLRG